MRKRAIMMSDVYVAWDDNTRIATVHNGDEEPYEVHGIHLSSECIGRHCVIHDPSDHAYRDWNLVWGFDGFTRWNPETDEEEVDPDAAAFRARFAGAKIRCLSPGCGEVIQSLHRHHMVWCKGKHVAVDGGSDYLRIVGGESGWEVVDGE